MDEALQIQDRFEQAAHRQKRRNPVPVEKARAGRPRKRRDESDFEDLFGSDTISSGSEAPAPVVPRRAARQAAVEQASIEADPEAKQRRAEELARWRKRKEARRRRRRLPPDESSGSELEEEEEEAPVPQEIAARLARRLVEANASERKERPRVQDPDAPADDVPIWKPKPLLSIQLMDDPEDIAEPPPLACPRCDFQADPEHPASKKMLRMDRIVDGQLGRIPDYKIWNDVQRYYRLALKKSCKNVPWPQERIMEHYTQHHITQISVVWDQLRAIRASKALLQNTGIRMADSNGRQKDRAATTGIAALLKLQAQELKLMKQLRQLQDM